MQFQWQLKNGSWVDYDEEENEKLCRAKAAGESCARYSARGCDYSVDLVSMVQENVSHATNASASTRKVRIRAADAGHEEPRRPSASGATGPSARAGPPVPPVSGPGLHAPHDEKKEKKFSLRSPRGDPRGDAGPAASPRGPHAGPAASPRGPPPPKDSTFDRAHGAAFGEPGGRTRGSGSTSAPPSGGGGAAPGTRTVHPPGAGAPPPRSDGGSSAARGKSGIKLPRGVDWPDEPKSREAAEAIFAELSQVPINERKKAFMKACLKWHPDKNLDDEDRATDVFQFLQSLKDWYLGE